jgi:anti-sigma factor RsiW
LAEYLEGGLPPACRQQVEEHLAGCADCCSGFAQATLFLREEELSGLRDGMFPLQRGIGAVAP